MEQIQQCKLIGKIILRHYIVTKKAIHVYIVKIGKVLNPENITKSQKSDHIIREKAPEFNLCINVDEQNTDY